MAPERIDKSSASGQDINTSKMDMIRLPVSNPFQLICNFLNERGVNYDILQHEDGLEEMQVMERCGLTLHQGAKSMVLKNPDESYALFVLAGDSRLDMKKIGSKKTRLAKNEEIIGLMGCEIGSCYPIGSLVGLTTYVDSSIRDNETIFFNPGVPDKWVKLRYADYVAVVNPQYVDVSK